MPGRRRGAPPGPGRVLNCVVINLDARPDRRAAFSAEFARAGGEHTLHRFAACTSKVARSALVNGRIGCLLSHRGAVALAHRRGWERVAVFEDDVELADGTAAALDRAQERLGPRWPLGFLGLNAQGPMLDRGDGTLRVSRSLALHAVMYHRSVYPRVLRGLPATADAALAFVARHKAVDTWYERHLIPRVGAYAEWPHLAHQSADHSDITGQPTVMTQDDAKTRGRVVGSRRAYFVEAAFWWTLRYPALRALETINPLRKRRLYAPADDGSARAI